MIYPGECSVCTYNIVYSAAARWNMPVNQFGLKVWFNSNIFLIFVWIIYQLLMAEYWSSLLLLYCIFLLPDVSIRLTYIRCSNVGCVWFYDCCIFLMYWPFYYKDYLSLITGSDLMSILSDISMITLAFFWSPLTWNIFLHPFTFEPVCLYSWRWIFFRQ